MCRKKVKQFERLLAASTTTKQERRTLKRLRLVRRSKSANRDRWNNLKYLFKVRVHLLGFGLADSRAL